MRLGARVGFEEVGGSGAGETRQVYGTLSMVRAEWATAAGRCVACEVPLSSHAHTHAGGGRRPREQTSRTTKLGRTVRVYLRKCTGVVTDLALQISGFTKLHALVIGGRRSGSVLDVQVSLIGYSVPRTMRSRRI